MLDSLCFTEDATYSSDLAAVEVEAKAWGGGRRSSTSARGSSQESGATRDIHVQDSQEYLIVTALVGPHPII